MNQLIFTTLLLFGGTVCSANAQMRPDTVITVENPNSVIVIRNDQKTSVSIVGSNNNPDFRFDYNVSPDSTDISQNLSLLPFTSDRVAASRHISRHFKCLHDLYAGAVIPTVNNDIFNTSWEIGIGRVVEYQVRKGSSQFSIGLGFGYRRLCVGRELTVDKSSDCLQLTAAPEGATDISSRINSWAIDLPVIFTQRLFKTIGFNIGVVCNFNFYTTASSSFNIEGKRINAKLKGLHQKILTPEIVAGVGSVNRIGLYFRWSPVSLFKSSFGPDIRFLSIGGSLAF